MPRKQSTKPGTAGVEPVVLRPPVELMQPTPVAGLPAEDALAGGAVYEVKLDGVRCAVFRTEEGTELWSKQQRRLNDRYPEVLPALTALLRPGTVLDGELCAWAGGKLAFTELLTTARARARRGVAVSYVAWDVLAVPGRDVRRLTLSERQVLLEQVLAEAKAPVERVMSTRSRETALQWYRELGARGVEGVVIKAGGSRYQPTTPARSPWLKLRHSDTVDAVVVGIVGSPARPSAALVRLADGRQAVTSPRLNGQQAAQLAAAVAGRLQPPAGDGTVQLVAEPLPVAEVLWGTTRHASVRYVRLRPLE